MRLPRSVGLIGNDAFIVIWMGQAVSEGYLANWLVSPLSFFGLYPFASYPIGVPAILAGLFQLGFNSDGAVLLITMVSSVVATIGAYRLGEYLFGDTNDGLIFAAFYNFSHIFLRYTYYTISARGPFMVILPFLVYYGIKYVRKRERLDLLKTVCLWILLSLIHSLFLFLVLYPIAALGFLLLNRLHGTYLKCSSRLDASEEQGLMSWDRSLVKILYSTIKRAVDITKRFEMILFLLLLVVSFLVGFSILPFDERKTTPFILTNDTLFGVIMNLIIDYGIRLGILSIFLPIGIIMSFKNSTYSGAKFMHVILCALLIFTIPTSLYSSVILFPVFAYYSVAGFLFSKRWVSETALSGFLLIFLVPFTYLYTTYVATLPSWILISVISIGTLFPIAILMLHFNRSRITSPTKLKKQINTSIIVLIVVVFSLLCTDGVILQDTRSSMSLDEFSIVDIIGDDPDIGLVFAPDIGIGRKMHAYKIPAIGAFDEDFALYFGWIEPEEIVAGSYFDIGSILVNGKPFSYEGRNPERDLFASLLNLDLTSFDDYNTAIILGLEYIIVEKDSNGYLDTIALSGNVISSLLLQTAPMACEIVYDGTDMSLFQLVET